MKKKLILVCAIITIAGLIAFYTYYKHLQELPEYLRESKNIKFETEAEREKYIKEFESREIDRINEELNTENSGGFMGITIENSDELLECVGLDGYIQIDDKLTTGIAILPKLYIDTKNIEINSELENYFNSYRELFATTFGITQYQEFKPFIKSLEFINDGEIEGARINSNIEKLGNVLKFELQLLSREKKHNEERTGTYIITAIFSTSNNNFIVVWESGMNGTN